ncbi:hypothetical protein POM88_052705 [Heracleum sosnowskyi]|uniref:Uncharacterized protein n=1 Tax=Heracleum sosnowskyi TaxID=360622 RepID=A0AAD8GPY4_9APIA|nr:hypothetical protein POM88_052705 [Heracleum sosnowskyi]
MAIAAIASFEGTSYNGVKVTVENGRTFFADAANVEDSEKAGKVTSAGMYFLHEDSQDRRSALCTKSYEDTTNKLKDIEAQILSKRNELRQFETEYRKALARYQEVTNRYSQEKQTEFKNSLRMYARRSFNNNYHGQSSVHIIKNSGTPRVQTDGNFG